MLTRTAISWAACCAASVAFAGDPVPSLSFHDEIVPMRVSVARPTASAPSGQGTPSSQASVAEEPRAEGQRRTVLLANNQAPAKPTIRGTFQVEQPAAAASTPVVTPVQAPPTTPATPDAPPTVAPPPARVPLQPAETQLAAPPMTPALTPATSIRVAQTPKRAVARSKDKEPPPAEPVPAKRIAAVADPTLDTAIRPSVAAESARTTTGGAASDSARAVDVSAAPAAAPKDDPSVDVNAGARARMPPQLRMPLPGMGAIPGARRLAPNTIRVTENTVEEVIVSSSFPNRIATPFPSPRVIDSSASDITKEGSSVFIKPSGNAPITVYITGDRANDPVIALLLKPAEIAPQVVVLALDERLKAAQNAADDVPAAIPNTYTAQLTQVLKTVAIGKTPAGFSGGKIPASTGRMGNLALQTEMRFSGREMEVFTYWVTNVTNEPLALDESMFYVEGVRAVAFFPETELAPQQSTRVLIVSATKTEVQ